jgi:hypothetical protein
VHNHLDRIAMFWVHSVDAQEQLQGAHSTDVSEGTTSVIWVVI